MTTEEFNREEFVEAYNLYPKGDIKKVCAQAQYAHIRNKVSYKLIIDKWKEYLEYNQKAKTPDEYVVSLDRFIDKEMYNSNYLVSMKLGFLNKYKKK